MWVKQTSHLQYIKKNKNLMFHVRTKYKQLKFTRLHHQVVAHGTESKDSCNCKFGKSCNVSFWVVMLVAAIMLPLRYKFPFNILTIILRVRMGYESIAHEAKDRMDYWLRGHEGERNNCFSKIQLVGQKNIETKRLFQVKARHQPFFTAITLQIWRALFATSGL